MKGIAVADDTAESLDSEGDRDSDATVERSEDQTPQSSPRRISLSLRALVAAAVMGLLAVALGAMTWLYVGERNTLADHADEAANRSHAEEVALTYAVGAATMNFEDLNGWKVKLVEGTSPELHDKLVKAADSMQQLLIPLQWNSTSKPLVAKVRSVTDGVYVVDTFVSVLTRTTQSPDSLQSTATYSITLDSGHNWQITDVGGIGAVVGAQ